MPSLLFLINVMALFKNSNLASLIKDLLFSKHCINSSYLTL
ncbi:hypothetical protein [Spiroplasma kunkelii]|nr:hypothetical protein [Spiroplasma kunkelii]